MIISIDLSQEVFAIDMLRALKSYLKHRCKHVLRPLQLYGDQALAMFTLYRIGFYSVAKVAPVQCEQELMFCCGAEIVPKRSQCEQKPYPSHNLQRCLLI